MSRSSPQLKNAFTKVCSICHQTGPHIARAIGICGRCLQGRPPGMDRCIEAIHTGARRAFGLPPAAPRVLVGRRCRLCGNECSIGEGGYGYCGLRTVRGGRLRHLAGIPSRGLLQWYRDPLPTNCVADWVCEGSRQRGRHNLAVFYASCTADCLFCQNWHFRKMAPEQDKTISAEHLAAVADAQTFCVCFFGGDPASQMPHALAAARRLAAHGIRICWETNGMQHPRLLDAAVELSLATGGCVKFDLKAFDEGLHIALTGVSNQRTLENFTRAVRRGHDRREPPLVVASTLLVPEYVGAEQVGKIARFIAAADPQIPYALLAFGPCFFMDDLPPTSLSHAQAAEAAAREAGLANVRVGNRHLLVRD